jgi:uncharacterized protein YjbI with pentapeptide repeats
MANPEHLEILKQGVKAWNEWRGKHRDIHPDLSGANLCGANLSRVSLRYTNLSNANLSDADLSVANILGADLSDADLRNANLRDANLRDTSLRNADLRDASFFEAFLDSTDFSRARLSGADLTSAILAHATFSDNDLSEVKGLEKVFHEGPSSIGVDTLYKSAGKIPEAFLRECGIPDDFIAFIPSHFGVQQAIQFYSCFISYSTRDEEFARRLYSRMRDAKLRVWFAPEEMKGGEKLYEQIERAIQLHDRLLLVLSESSMRSEWVINEIQRARETEIREGRRKLFPITIVEFDKVKAWRRFDADTGKDLAKEVREYFIPDFSNWKDQDAFERAFERLLRDLKAEEARR